MDENRNDENVAAGEEMTSMVEPVEWLCTDDEMLDMAPVYPSEEHLAYPDGSNEKEEEFSLEMDYFDEEKQEDKLWKARTGLDEDSLCGAIETIIFMSDKPVALNKIKGLIDEDMPLRVVHEALARLQNEYESKHHGLRLLEVAEGYQFRTKATYSKYVQDLFKVNSLVLSPTALEVLAVIAYKQPMPKTEVDKIRGVDSSHIVRGLMDKRLVRVVGRSDEVGRPALYGTTPEFLEVFNLADLDQLPSETELESMTEASVGKIADIKTLVNSGEKDRFVFDEMEELDQLSQSIKSIPAETDFTKSLKVEEKKRTNEAGEAVKSAFDILEEFVVTTSISKANELSSESEMPTALIDPQVIKDLLAGPFNVPQPEEDDFQMIDLDTGEAIVDDNTATEVLPEDGQTPEELFATDENEAQALSEALDDAFAKLTGENLQESGPIDEAEVEEAQVQAEGLANDIDELTDQIVAEAADFDLDLSFLNTEDENNSEASKSTEE